MMGLGSSPAVIPYDTSGNPILIADVMATIQRYGMIHGKTSYAFNIIGRRAGFTSLTAMNDVKEFDNAVANFPQLAGNEVLEVVSSSTLDVAAGTGARTVKVVYLNSSNAMVESAAITLNGLVPVAAGFTANEILWMEVATVGSGGTAAGNVLLRTTVGQVGVEQVSAGGNKSLSARFMVPANYTGYLTNWNAYAINNDQDVRLQGQVATLDRSLSSVYRFLDNIYLSTNANAFAVPLPWLKIPPLARVKASTISTGGTGAAVRCDVSFTVVIIQN